MAAGDRAYWSDLQNIADQLVKPAIGKAFTTSQSSAIGTSETVALTVTSMLFKAGWAYRAFIRTAVYGSAAGVQASFRLRKTNAAGADWGELGRVRCEGTTLGTSAMANGSLILTRSAVTDLTTDVALVVAASTGTVTLWAGAASPRYLVIEPIGSAADYADLGVDVT